MKKSIIVLILTLVLLPTFLLSNFNYLTEEEYNSLNRRERQIYWDDLQNEMTNLQQRKSDAIVRHEQNVERIAEVRSQIESLDQEYTTVYNRIINNLGLTSAEIEAARRKITQYHRNIDDWNNMSDSDLWSHAKAVRQTINEYNEFTETNVAQAPDFRDDIVELDRKIVNLESNLERARPKYYEDSYTVVRGDYLSKIAGYSFIYDDSSKWGIIYRANRDQIRDPNLIYPDQVLKIPRGLPNTWRVHRGESLWRIASYPEVYGRGTDWVLIHRANRDQIRNPDLIYPDQVFTIPRD